MTIAQGTISRRSFMLLNFLSLQVGRYGKAIKKTNIHKVATRTADFYLAPVTHNGRWFGLTDDCKINGESLEKLHQEHPNLQIALEGIGATRKHMGSLKLEDFFTASAEDYLLNEGLPVAFIEGNLGSRPMADVLSSLFLDTAVLFGWSTIMAVVTKGLAGGANRRRVLYEGTLGASMALAAFKYAPSGLLFGLPVAYDFRNALWATKLLMLGQRYYQATNERPAFLIAFGGAHYPGLRRNLEEGYLHSVLQLKKADRELGLDLVARESSPLTDFEFSKIYYYSKHPTELGFQRVRVEDFSAGLYPLLAEEADF